MIAALKHLLFRCGRNNIAQMKSSLIRNVRYLAASSKHNLLINNGSKHSIDNLRISRSFHNSLRREAVIPYLLADIGEGITECQIMEWFVEPGSRVEQFDKICEVQSDKASVEITSRFDGVIKSLYYSTDDMAIVGKPLVDIDVDGDVPEESTKKQEADDVELATQDIQEGMGTDESEGLDNKAIQSVSSIPPPLQPRSNETGRGITTPGVRHILKQMNLNISDIKGTGKNGRVKKEDVEKYSASLSGTSTTAEAALGENGEDELVALNPTENQMFKVMTRSLEIPHFLYTHSVNVTPLNNLRKRFNTSSGNLTPDKTPKLSPLPFIIKAISEVIKQFPKLNAHLDTTSSKPQLLLKASHNFGIAVDTPKGLVVPVLRDVQNRSILSISTEIARLSELAKSGKLSIEDFKGATLTISNIGSIGGGVVAPIIVSPMVAIIGIGRTKTVPVFEDDGKGGERLGKREETLLSWSADHRVLDGAAVARCAEAVGNALEDIDLIGVSLR